MILFLLLARTASAEPSTVALADDEPVGDEPGPMPAADPADGHDPADFGDHLLALDDPFNALTWYRRALWEDPDRPDADALRFRVAYTYERGERWAAAEVAYGQLASRSELLAAQASYRQGVVTALSGDTDAAIFHLEGVESWYPEAVWAQRATFATGVLALQEHQLELAAARFDRVDGELGTKAAALADRAREPLPTRSPLVAAGLSTVVPGGGQLYAGHRGDAIMAFAASSVLALWSTTLIVDGLADERVWEVGAGAVVGGMAGLAWTSNVVGAWRGADRANRHHERRRAEAILEDAWDERLELHSDEVELPARD